MLNLPAGVVFLQILEQVQHVPRYYYTGIEPESHRHVPARRVDRKGNADRKNGIKEYIREEAERTAENVPRHHTR